MPVSDRLRASRLHAVVLVLRTIAMVVGPLAVCGIAVGASSVILVQGDPSLHRFLLTVVWSAAVLISAVIVTGVLLLGREGQ